MIKLIINYSSLGEAAFVTQSLAIVNGLTGNARFPLPWPTDIPTLAELTTAQSEYATAVTAAIDRDKGKIADRNAKREILADMIREIAPHLESIADGDIVALESTGYALSKERSAPTDIPDAPTGLKLRNGSMPGSLVASAKAPKGAGSFETQVCTGDPAVPANWHTVAQTTSSRGVELNGLQRGVDHYVRMRAIGSKGPGPWSNIETAMPV